MATEKLISHSFGKFIQQPWDTALQAIIDSADLLDLTSQSPCDMEKVQPNLSFGPPWKSANTFVLYYQQVCPE